MDVQKFYADIVRFIHMDNKLDPKFDYYLDFTTQEKLDGSHGCIFKYLDQIYYASRNIVLEKQEGNNFMFKFKELAIKDTGIQNYMNSHPDHVLYGEFMKEESKFYVFDIGKVIVGPKKDGEETTRVEMLNFRDMEKTLEEFKILYIPTEFHVSGSFQEQEAKWKEQSKPNMEGAVFKFYKNGKMCKVMKVLNNNYFRNVPSNEKKTSNNNPEADLWNSRKNAISSCLLNMVPEEDNKVFLKDLIDKVVDDLMEDVKDNSVIAGSFRKFVARKVMESYKDKEVRKNVFGDVLLYSKKGETKVLL